MRIYWDDTDKFAELLLYVAKACESDPRFGATKLNKILFFSDFISFRRRRKSITGATYMKLDHGPAPKCMLPVRKTLIEEGHLAIQDADYYGRPQQRPIALRQPNLEAFSGEDISIVDNVIRGLSEWNATQVSELSHGFWWELAEDKEDIPLAVSLVQIPDQVTESARKHGESLEGDASRLASTT